MNSQELERLRALEQRIGEIAKGFGLATVPIDFEVVPAQRMFEAMAYGFPTNFSHWTFGRDYEQQRTIYDHTGGGIPYEIVWNYEVPRAFLVETNPFALNVLVVAHVYGHVDFFLKNHFLQKGRMFGDIASETREAASRFRQYEERYGKEDVERVIDAAMSTRWHQHPDPFFLEPDEEQDRERLMQMERAKLERGRDVKSEFAPPLSRKELRDIEKRLKTLSRRTPPQPVHDLLWYIMRKSPKPLRPWEVDVISVVRNQARALAFNRRTKILNEGWASYWHVRIMRKLFEEGRLTPEEHGLFGRFHAGVVPMIRRRMNPYAIGLALYEHIEERWNRGQFGRDYDECENPGKKAYWDTQAGLGRQKIFEVRAGYSDRMAIEDFFDADFIRKLKLYFYSTEVDPKTKDLVDVIADAEPETVRRILKKAHTLYGIPVMTITNGNYQQRGELYLKHAFDGEELDASYRDGALKNIHYLWGRPVHLETKADGKATLFTYDGKRVTSDSDEPSKTDDGDGLMYL